MCDRSNWSFGDRAIFRTGNANGCTTCGNPVEHILGECATYVGHVFYNGKKYHRFVFDKPIYCGACYTRIKAYLEPCDSLSLVEQFEQMANLFVSVEA